MATSSARRSKKRPSSSAASRRACVVWRTMTTGRTSSSVRCCSTRVRISSSTAWASTRSSRSPTRSTPGCPSTRSPTSTAPSTVPARSTKSTTTTCCPAGTTFRPTSSTTHAALTCSSKTWTPLPGIAWWSPTPTTSTWCRTRRRQRSPPTRWTRSPSSPTRATGIPTTMPRAACRPLPRSSFPSAPTAAALASARFARSPSTRAACCRCAATIRLCARPSYSRATRSLRATSTTWADRQQTLAARPVTSSSNTAYARTSAACGRACARTWWSTRAAIRSCCAICVSCRASRRSLCAAASALTTPWPTPRTSFCASCWSTMSRASCAWRPST